MTPKHYWLARSLASYAALALLSVGLVGRAAGDELEWRADYSKARQEAAAKNRPLVIDFGTENCVWCRKLEETTFRDPAIVALLNQQCILLRIDANRNPALAEALRIQNFPTLVYASPDGRVLGSHEGYIETAGLKDHLERIIAAVGDVEWMVKGYADAVKAREAGDFPKALALLKPILEEGKGRPIHAQAMRQVKELENLAAARALAAKPKPVPPVPAPPAVVVKVPDPAPPVLTPPTIVTKAPAPASPEPTAPTVVVKAPAPASSEPTAPTVVVKAPAPVSPEPTPPTVVVKAPAPASPDPTPPTVVVKAPAPASPEPTAPTVMTEAPASAPPVAAVQSAAAIGELSQMVKEALANRKGLNALITLASRNETTEQTRSRQAQDLLVQARDDYRKQQYLACLDRCEILINSYGDLAESVDAGQMAAEIKKNPEWTKLACIQLGDRLCLLYMNLAENYLIKGEPQQAIYYLERIQQTAPNSRHADLAQARLTQLQGMPTPRR
jgi:thioredoxin-related protein